jgi:hypothetical protein
MNVFEDLVVELKEQNLLEDTVMDALVTDAEELDFGATVLGEEVAFMRRPEADLNAEILKERLNMPALGSSVSQPQFHKHYSERAANLRMVEHVVSAIERQLRRAAVSGFDDLQLNKALQAFLQVSSDPDSDEFIEAEQNVRRSIGPWERALAIRDEGFSVGDLRRYCETCQPALSPQALFSLARFYYEMPKNTAVRAKFDFVITKLFSRPTSNGGRQMICSKQEAVGHLSSRFAHWSTSAGISVDDPKRFAFASRCTDFLTEVARIDRLDDLLKGDFFERIRKFKESAEDLIFSPEFAASVVECNIRIGNRFVELMQSENQRASFQQVLDEYVSDGRNSIEDASGRIFDMDEIMRPGRAAKAAPERKPRPEKKPVQNPPAERRQAESSFERAPEEKGSSFISLQVNKWLLGSAALLVIISVGLYLWAEQSAAETEPISARAANLSLDGFEHKQYLKSAKVSSETLYATTAPEFDALPKPKKEEILTKLFQTGREKGFNKVSLMNGTGKAVGFASAQRLELKEP